MFFTKATKITRPTYRPTYSLTDAELMEKFGDCWQFAKDHIEMMRYGEDGVDWYKLREGYDRTEPITENQKNMLTSGLGVSVFSVGRLTKYEASCLIDMKMLENAVERERERRAKAREREAQREAARAAREREREEKRLLREEARLQKLKPVSRKKLAEWQTEFLALWNGILADDVLEVDELLMIKSWLIKHRRRPDDYAGMIAAIDNSIQDGVVDADESLSLYNEAVAVYELLGLTNGELLRQTA